MQINSMIGFLVITCLLFGAMFAFELKQNNEKNDPVKNESILNDDWGTSVSPNKPNSDTISEDVKPQQQIVATSYADAIKKSGKHGMPVMVFFEASWCHWCTKMKNETLSDNKVKEIMKNYILVYVDYDTNKSIVRKFGVRGLPSYVITNVEEKKLKLGSGHLVADKFVKWLDNPSMYKQPKTPLIK